MGYTTSFRGKFALVPPVEDVEDLRGIEMNFPHPDGYCQWEIGGDGASLAWDGEEKFYDYTEWLQALVDGYFTPMGVTVAGSVEWQGEEMSDRGVLSVANGKVTAVHDEDRKVAKTAIAQRDFLIEKLKRDIVPMLRDEGSRTAADAIEKALKKVGA